MANEKKEPKYIRTRGGSVFPIAGYPDKPDVYPNKNSTEKPCMDEATKNELVATLRPELVISEEEYSKMQIEKDKKKYETCYKPIAEALSNGPLNLQQISEITGRPKYKEKKYLERLCEARLVEKKDEVYKALVDIAKSFGAE